MNLTLASGVARNNPHNCAIGDYFYCSYKNAAQAVGTFSLQLDTMLGKMTILEYANSDNHLPFIATAQSGSFKAICVYKSREYNLYMADRIIQNAIGYDVIKASGFIDFSVPIKLVKHAKVTIGMATKQNLLDAAASSLLSKHDLRTLFNFPQLSTGFYGGYQNTTMYCYNLQDNTYGNFVAETTATDDSTNSANYNAIMDWYGQYSTGYLMASYDGGIHGGVPATYSKSFVNATYTMDASSCPGYVRSGWRPIIKIEPKPVAFDEDSVFGQGN